MKHVLVAVLILICYGNAQAKSFARGTEGVGGGDPLAIEFVAIGDSISDFLSSSNMFPEIEREDFKSVLKGIRASLDDGKNQPQIIFQESEVICAGVSKVGCVHANQKISVQRIAWSKLNQRERIELVSLEVLQLLNFTGRYSLAQSIGLFANDISTSRSKVQGLTCMTIAIERALHEARREYPKYLAMVPTKAVFSGIEDVNGGVKNKYEVSIQVTTSDDYFEDLTFEYKFLNKNCIR